MLVLSVGPYDGIVLANLLALLVSATVLASSWRQSAPRLTANAGVTVAAGITSGFMTATAAMGGPALTVCALATGWR